MVEESKPVKKTFPKWMQDMLAGLVANPEVAGLAASVGTIALGVALALDDAKDFGKLGDERDPPVPHHWEYGILMLLGGIAGLGLSILDLLSKQPPLKRAPLPLSLEEQGAPIELVEKFR